MKIKVEKWITDEYENKSYKIKSIEKCCDKLTNSNNISINNDYCEGDNSYDDDSYSVKLVRKEEEGIPWEDYMETNYYYEKIDFCPFCGEKIEIEFMDEVVDKQEELKQLRKEREEVWSKCRKTDSKKKEQELQKRVRELDDKISEIHMNDDFTKEEV
jgi:DNA repair exonuclease SbcCD ATPase subunit